MIPEKKTIVVLNWITSCQNREARTVVRIHNGSWEDPEEFKTEEDRIGDAAEAVATTLLRAMRTTSGAKNLDLIFMYPGGDVLLNILSGKCISFYNPETGWASNQLWLDLAEELKRFKNVKMFHQPL